MMKMLMIFFFLISMLAGNTLIDSDPSWSKDSSVGDALIALGDKAPSHARPNASEEDIQRGYELVHLGKSTSPNGKRGGFISKFYACTSCHNQDREDPNLLLANPESRLDYILKQEMKFLQGSTFYGIANRENWYGGDYYLKYGELVKPANKSLEEATQLCAKVCSSGRYLEDWELEAILAYYWQKQLKLSELELSEKAMVDILNALKKEKKDSKLVSLIKSKYLLSLPVHFGKLPSDMVAGYEYEGDPENGKKLYEFSCQSCHQEGGASTVLLPMDQPTLRKFANNLDKNSSYNLYKIIREGTYTEKGKPRYMPLYPEEKLSDRQIEDIRSFITQETAH